MFWRHAWSPAMCHFRWILKLTFTSIIQIIWKYIKTWCSFKFLCRKRKWYTKPKCHFVPRRENLGQQGGGIRMRTNPIFAKCCSYWDKMIKELLIFFCLSLLSENLNNLRLLVEFNLPYSESALRYSENCWNISLTHSKLIMFTYQMLTRRTVFREMLLYEANPVMLKFL